MEWTELVEAEMVEIVGLNIEHGKLDAYCISIQPGTAFNVKMSY